MLLFKATAVEIFPFLVVASSYFDDIPTAAMQQIDYKDEVDFTACTLPFGTVYISISVSRTGYCLGEVKFRSNQIYSYFQTITPLIYIKNTSRKALKDCRIQLVLKTQYEAISRYEHVSDKKLVEQQLDIDMLGKIKGRSDAVGLKLAQNSITRLEV